MLVLFLYDRSRFWYTMNGAVETKSLYNGYLFCRTAYLLCIQQYTDYLLEAYRRVGHREITAKEHLATRYQR
jgi:hypothetical protein